MQQSCRSNAVEMHRYRETLKSTQKHVHSAWGNFKKNHPGMFTTTIWFKFGTHLILCELLCIGEFWVARSQSPCDMDHEKYEVIYNEENVFVNILEYLTDYHNSIPMPMKRT